MEWLPGVRAAPAFAPLMEQALEAAQTGRPLSVGYLNAHTLALARSDPAFAADLAALDALLCDGFAIRWASRVAHPEALPERHTGADWIWQLAAAAEHRQLRLGWWGGPAGRAAQAVAALRTRHPALPPVWCHHGHHSPASDRHIAQSARRAGVQLLLLGLGSPRQEALARWLGNGAGPPVRWCLGATADVLSGAVPRGPRWMTAHGLEWAARLGAEPARLWRRYLVELPPTAIWLLRRALTARLAPDRGTPLNSRRR